MSTHNICFCQEVKILCGYPLLSVAMKTKLMLEQLIGAQFLRSLIRVCAVQCAFSEGFYSLQAVQQGMKKNP